MVPVAADPALADGPLDGGVDAPASVPTPITRPVSSAIAAAPRIDTFDIAAPLLDSAGGHDPTRAQPVTTTVPTIPAVGVPWIVQ